MSVLEEMFGSGVVRTQTIVKAEGEGSGAYVGIRRTVEVGNNGAAKVVKSLPTLTLRRGGVEVSIALAPDVAADIADALDQVSATARQEAL